MPQGFAIHVVDDDQHVRDSLEILLAAHGYAVQGYASAEALLAALPNQARHDLAVVDLDLPGIDGLALLGQLAGRLPAIAISGRLDDVCRQATQAGALAYLQKPFDPRELLAAIAGLSGGR